MKSILDSINFYEQQITLYPEEHKNYWHLGVLYYLENREDEAESIWMSIFLQGTDREIHIWKQELVEILESIIEEQFITNNYKDVAKLYQLIIEVDQDYCRNIFKEKAKELFNNLDCYIKLVDLFLSSGQLLSVIALSQAALFTFPQSSIIYKCLAETYQLMENYAQTEINFGHAAFYEKDYYLAVSYYLNYLEHTADNNDTPNNTLEVYLNLMLCYQSLGELDNVVRFYQDAINYFPKEHKLYQLMFYIYRRFDCIKDAKSLVMIAIELFPDKLSFYRLQQALLPVIYHNLEDLDYFRNNFIDLLDQLILKFPLTSEKNTQEALRTIGLMTNYYLHYQAKDDTTIQKKYGNFVVEVMQSNYPNWSQPIPIPDFLPTRKIKVGYVSLRLQQPLGRFLNGWLKYCNRNQFEIFLYALEDNINPLYSDYYNYSDHYYTFYKNLEAIATQIFSDQLDILVFMDIGIDVLMTQLSALRLAPIQCTTWAHPVTSGLPTIDYFLSSDLMEPDHGQEHYSEKLIRLPNLGICYSIPKIPTQLKSRLEFGFQDSDIIYLSCQYSAKYLPQYDHIFPRIALLVPDAKFVFLDSDISSSITQKFMKRLQGAFAKYDLVSDNYCLCLPRCSPDEFINLNICSDIALDTIGWSGGFTTLDAIATYTPVVTYPTEFMRGRHSYAILKRIGLEELIAQDIDDYIEIAIELGNNLNWRTKIIQKIQGNYTTAYEDKTCVHFLEQFYREVLSCQF